MHGLLERDYYRRAISYIRRKSRKKITIFLFSDGFDWCKSNMDSLGFAAGDEVVLVEGNTGEDSYKDMQLMSLCKYFVLPHGTFSLWGAFLSQREGKIVVAPYESSLATVSF